MIFYWALLESAAKLSVCFFFLINLKFIITSIYLISFPSKSQRAIRKVLQQTGWAQAPQSNRDAVSAPGRRGVFVCLNGISIPLQFLKPEGWSVKHENLKVKPTGSQKRNR